MKGQQISFINTDDNKKDTYGLYTKVRIPRYGANGVVIKLSLTKKHAYVAYSYDDDKREDKMVFFAYFNVKDELRILE